MKKELSNSVGCDFGEDGSRQRRLLLEQFGGKLREDVGTVGSTGQCLAQGQSRVGRRRLEGCGDRHI